MFQLGSLNVADCKWLVRACKPLATWRWSDPEHAGDDANWIGLMQVMLSMQGLWTMAFLASQQRAGLFAPVPWRL
eukprot:CAMPEP_0202757318 /NCGR_PEP_ID=MMETSP1388-20130828/16293_1 /ASSEMBLY_ACC=CAM_ASM_000864 /TAXON_ID=37098 /ORGANISM="Isochrysis sp, Strain CCMP1244" /LENGTH=74 /DNA_ID=CAMNT_0049425203 /DNA_START=112 /DNA_END=332 /DNA_ORIENTATION=-